VKSRTCVSKVISLDTSIKGLARISKV